MTEQLSRWHARPEPPGESHWAFPDPGEWPDDDLIAIGGDLEPATLIAAYRCGLFPMGVDLPNRVCGWWSPNPRGILPLDRLRITNSLRRSVKRFEVRVDTSFGDVMRGCALPSRKGAWITSDFVDAYSRLHRMGWAHSVEVFDKSGKLAGGLYGVRINRFFAGESMFHRQPDASKVALVALVELMRESGMTLLDVQWQSDHLSTLGVIEVPRQQYLSMLAEAVGAMPQAC